MIMIINLLVLTTLSMRLK
ncbi:hypothetical protein LINPERPRIM_LOCUS16086 [Linum perenne]